LYCNKDWTQGHYDPFNPNDNLYILSLGLDSIGCTHVLTLKKKLSKSEGKKVKAIS